MTLPPPVALPCLWDAHSYQQSSLQDLRRLSYVFSHFSPREAGVYTACVCLNQASNKVGICTTQGQTMFGNQRTWLAFWGPWEKMTGLPQQTEIWGS